MSLFEIRKKLLNKKIKKWQQERELLIAEQQMKKERKEIKSRSKTTTSKLLTFFLFGSCTAIEIFTLVIIVKGMNMGYGITTGPLEMLISSLFTEVAGFAVYSLKAAKQNTKGGIIYEAAMNDWEPMPEENNNQEEPVG